MAKVYLTIGNIGSGKSTWAKALAEAQPTCTLIINRDALRKMVAGSYRYSLETEPVLKKMAIEMLQIALAHDYNVILDETNITARTRKGWLNLIPKTHEVTYVVFKDHGANVDWRMRDDGRGHTAEYWYKVYQNMRNQYEPPSIDEFIETKTKGMIIDG